MGPSPAIVYITEVARPDLRGSLICTGPSMTSLGENETLVIQINIEQKLYILYSVCFIISRFTFIVTTYINNFIRCGLFS